RRSDDRSRRLRAHRGDPRLRLPRLRALPRRKALVSAQGIAQIAVYAVVLIVLAYPLGVYMARVYSGRPLGVERWLGVFERGFYRLVGTDRTREQDWKGYAKTVLVFSAVFSAVLYALLRLQGHLFLNPDGLKGVPAHISLNT